MFFVLFYFIYFSFFFFREKITFHINHLPSRQFIWNAMSCFLLKIIKLLKSGWGLCKKNVLNAYLMYCMANSYQIWCMGTASVDSLLHTNRRSQWPILFKPYTYLVYISCTVCPRPTKFCIGAFVEGGVILTISKLYAKHLSGYNCCTI